MTALNILSLTLFGIFIIAYVSKLVILYGKNSIRANVLAKGKKISGIRSTELFVKIATFIWGGAWLFLSLAESFIVGIVGRHFNEPLVNFIGAGIVSLGCAVFILAMKAMRTSWRVGIDKSTATKLITRGIYKVSRNAAFVGFDLMFAGLYLMYPSFLTLIIAVFNILAIHLLILQEEKHLRETFGKAYSDYCRKTPRYI
ncbi:isoprenylcysteine carboxylmethyltransferase family protein [Paenibacillus sp. MMS20-IR301]|uniref:methyltransferase family protein n=1 Tax=Paenibacillus sp. MMS20-IR301 TaxID=2895946 RepID=UPI0028E726DE|nr:isoprenylcysteine carboxylmethyltransferase family protein [Paenibacillus sp. MMS20-IR301]WNS42576.1 isoprenylcysteine carboxylmethyltransferase family protein [Paenibacillus sp. MMS20-IR301]